MAGVIALGSDLKPIRSTSACRADGTSIRHWHRTPPAAHHRPARAAGAAWATAAPRRLTGAERHMRQQFVVGQAGCRTDHAGIGTRHYIPAAGIPTAVPRIDITTSAGNGLVPRPQRGGLLGGSGGLAREQMATGDRAGGLVAMIPVAVAATGAYPAVDRWPGWGIRQRWARVIRRGLPGRLRVDPGGDDQTSSVNHGNLAEGIPTQGSGALAWAARTCVTISAPILRSATGIRSCLWQRVAVTGPAT